MPIFCAVPWNHFHVTATQKFGICCLSNTENDSSSTFEEHWNSDLMKNLRASMIKGEPDHEICKLCIQKENTETPYYVWQNIKAEPFIQEILEKTSLTGKTNYLPRTLDIRTDLCNLKCRMCSEAASTSIRQEFVKHKIKVIPKGKLSEESSKISDDHAKILTQVTWAGGEPFMSPVHWEIMDQLVRVGNTNVNLFYNSNMTFPGKTLQRTIDVLKNFKDVEISASIDAVGEDVEYIREGLDYSKFIENLKILKSELPHITFGVGYTATSMGLLTLDKVIELCNEYNLIFEGRKALLTRDLPLSIDVLSIEAFEDSLSRAEAVVNENNRDRLVSFTNFLRRLYKPHVPNLDFAVFQESMRGKSGYFEKRMKGKLYSPDNS